MFYPDHIIEELREANDLVSIVSAYTSLKLVSGNYRGACPLHGGSNTSAFSVDPVKQMYYCYNCQRGGNVYHFIQNVEGLDFLEAVQHLANRVNYQLPTKERPADNKAYLLKEALYAINKQTAHFFYNNMRNDDKAVAYLKSRGLTPQVVKKFGIGYAQDSWDSLYTYLKKQGHSDQHLEKLGLVARNKSGGFYDRFRDRLMFPIIDRHKRVIGFGGRAIHGDEPKYINSSESPIYHKSESLYAINFVKKSDTDILITEGYMDAIALYQAGFTNIVASLGTSFTTGHVKQLARLATGVILVFDGDEAGTTAAHRAIEQLKKSGLRIRLLTLQEAKDPDEYIQKWGAESFYLQLKQATPYIEYQLTLLKKAHDLQDTASRIEFTRKAADLISHIHDPIEKDAYMDHIARISHISKDVIKTRLTETAIQSAIQKPKLSSRSANNRGLIEAQEQLLGGIASSYFVYNALVNVIAPEEFNQEIYQKILTILYDLYKETDTIQPARVLNYFYDPNDQAHVAKILQYQPNLDKNYLAKSLTDQVKLIKKAYIETQFEKATQENDPNATISRLNHLKNVENLNISGFNG